MNKKLVSKIFLASMLLSVSAVGAGVGLSSGNSIAGTSSIGSYSESVSLTNSSFNSSSSTYSRGDVSGWSRIKADGSATTMIIDSQKNYSVNRGSVYYLPSALENPSDASSDESDHKILMVNSALKSNQVDGYAHEGYRSSEISLSANSHYYFQVAMKTASFNDSIEFGSVYLNGIKDEDGNSIKLAFEQQTVPEWTNYYFFLETGSFAQTVTLDLWLGTESTNSYGAAFFDEVYIFQYSENLFYDKLYELHSEKVGTEYVQKDTTKFLSLAEEQSEMVGYNFGFENGATPTETIPGFKIVDTNSIHAHAEILNMLSKEGFETKTGKTYPGANFGYENEKSLVLWTDETASIAVESKAFDIKMHGYYKISMLVKTDLKSGSFFVKVIESTDNLFSNEDFKELKDYYTTHSGTSEGKSSTSGNDFNNGYELVTFFIEGSSLYDTQAKLQLSIGNSEEGALGYAVIDDIKVETVSASEYSSANSKLSFAQAAVSETIPNGMFNFTDNQKSDLVYPLAPKDWTISQEDTDYMAAGVINTYSQYFERYKTDFPLWGNTSNPAKITDAPQDETNSNNVFMFFNAIAGAQSLTNKDTFSISSGNYYELSFAYKTYGGNLTVELVNDDNVVLFRDSDVSANGPWETYKAYFYTGEASHSVKVVIRFGDSEKKEEGYAFIDNIKIGESNDAVFNSASKKADLSNFLLNLDAYGKVGSTLSQHSAFNGSMTAGVDGEGGVIIGKGNTSYSDQNNEPIDKNTELKNNVLVIRVGESSTYTLTSGFKIDVEADAYYSLKFKLLTNYLPDEKDLPKKDEDGKDITYNYGVSIGLSNFDKVTKLQSNEGWSEYTILLNSTSAESANFVFSLISDNDQTYGTAFLTDIVWTKLDDSSAFDAAADKEEFNKTLFTASTTKTEDGDDDSDDDTTTEPTTTEDFNWLLIPSLIFSLALVIAIVGIIIRKIRTGKKKAETKEKEVYDRAKTLQSDVIKKEAKDLQAAEAEKTEKDIKTLQDNLANLDESHKEFINESRAKNDGKITKEIERQFKMYSSKRAKLSANIQVKKEQLQTINSPEYLLSLERKVANEASKLNKQSQEKQTAKTQNADSKKEPKVSDNKKETAAKKKSSSKTAKSE